MTRSSDTAPDPALREAIGWTVLLADDPDDRDLRAEFEQWLARDPGHAAAWAHASHVTGLIVQTRKVAVLPAGKTVERKVSARPAAKWPARSFAAIAATALLSLLAPDLWLRWQADYTTGAAEQRVVELEDGSTARLAPGSSLRVAYAGDRRGVELLSGEAYFEVAPDPGRPFQVAAKATTVTVLGTGFDVRLGDAGTDVAVKHGRVRVENPHGEPPVSSTLTDGQWVRLAANGHAVGGTMSPATVGSWTGDRLVAIDRPLSEVIADLRRYYNGAIVLTDDGLGRRTVTGSYDVGDPAAAVRLMVQPHGGSVRRITPWLLLISAADQKR